MPIRFIVPGRTGQATNGRNKLCHLPRIEKPQAPIKKSDDVTVNPIHVLKSFDQHALTRPDTKRTNLQCLVCRHPTWMPHAVLDNNRQSAANVTAFRKGQLKQTNREARRDVLPIGHIKHVLRHGQHVRVVANQGKGRFFAFDPNRKNTLSNQELPHSLNHRMDLVGLAVIPAFVLNQHGPHPGCIAKALHSRKLGPPTPHFRLHSQGTQVENGQTLREGICFPGESVYVITAHLQII